MTSNIVEAMVSVKRLSDYLNAQELQSDARTLINNENMKPGDKVSFLFDLFTLSSRQHTGTHHRRSQFHMV